AFPHSAQGAGGALGLASAGTHGAAALGRLGAGLRPSDLLSGDLHRSGAVSGDLLPGGELGAAGTDHGAGQKRSDESTQPFDQRGTGLSAHAAVSPVAAGGSMKPGVERLDVTVAELEALLEGVREPLGEAGYQKLKAALRTLAYVTELLENREATLATLRRLLCRASTEKTAQVLKQAGVEGGEKKPMPAGQRTPETPAPGHGRREAAAYRGAQKVKVPHGSLHQGDRCPECLRGKVYPLRDPGLLVRIQGQAPIAATVYELEKLRCNLCGEVFTAEAPEEVGTEKYDATAASMIALLRYGSGFPWNRLEGLEGSLGIPLPAATQCEIVAQTATTIRPALQELIDQAAQGEVLYNDDTSMRVLALL